MNALRFKSAVKAAACLLSMSCAAAVHDIPFSAIRLRKPQTDNAEIWKRTFAQFVKYRDAVDDVWFSTGICFPPMAEHRAAAKRLAAAAEDLRGAGILPSLQIQATIGHGDSLVHYADNRGLAWQTYVASDGTAAEAMNCPRAPEFIAYMKEMTALYAAAVKPYSVWIDDDIRIINHHGGNGGSSGWGCHCARCTGLFSAKEGRTGAAAWTRETLVEAMKNDKKLEARWRAFAFDGEALLVRAIADAVRAASPGTRMCVQQPGACFAEHRALYEACRAATGLPVAMRPGAGSYYDHDARAQIRKAYILALQMDTVGVRTMPWIDRICNEIETCPRSFACRSGRGVLLEAIEALSQGMNSISALAIDAGFETPEWYGEEILAPLARNAAMLKRYVAASEGAERAGYGVCGRPGEALLTGSLPLKPLAAGERSALARFVTKKDAKDAIEGGKETVAALLTEDLVLDGGAACELAAAGYGGEIGLAAGPGNCILAGYSLRERFTADPLNDGFLAREAPVDDDVAILKPAGTARTISEYCSDMNAAVRPGAAAYVFETPAGRRRAVFGNNVFTSALAVASGDRILQLHRVADWASRGKAPAVLETPTRSFVQPRTRADGSTASVVFVNASVGTVRSARLRLRGVPADRRHATWQTFDAPAVRLDIEREGGDAIVVLPPVEGWNAGCLLL